MSTDYTKKKVDELQDRLKARSLPHTGKKAELVARLQQNDTERAAASKAAPAPVAEDEIDWEDDAAAATTDAGAAAIAAGGLTQTPNPVAVPNQVIDTDPSKTNDLKVDPPAPDTNANVNATAADSPVKDFASGVESSTLDAELAKRQARAARFGITESNEDALKAIERAKKFGTGSEGDKIAVKGLNEALPERRPKRGRGMEGDGGRDGAKRSRVRGERDGGARRGGGGGVALSGKDKEAAEARKKRFAAA